ncbi:MAG: Ca2+-binding protein toxin [Caulobacter sp.]|nr:Ca2+-binding protein toxin [Caulobacter sp.]
MALNAIYGGINADKLGGGLGDDNIYGGGGGDALFGDAGNDNLRGGDGMDHLFGGEGIDMLNGDAGADILEGGNGDDTYVVDDAGDQVIEQAGQGSDSVKAYISYTLTDNVERLDLMGGDNLNATGNGGDNTLKGNTGDNVLSGLDGKDSMSGGDGADTLIGGAGHDWYQGGAGADTFVLDGIGSTETAGAVSTKSLNSVSSDAITDFISGQDHIQVNLSEFAGVNAGVLQGQYFTVGTVATADHAQFIFDAAHKALLFDADGTGSGKAVKIADINAGATVAAGDILVHQNAPAEGNVITFDDMGNDAGSDAMLSVHGFSFTSDLWTGEISALLANYYYGPNQGYTLLSGGVGGVGYAYAEGAPLNIQRADGADFVFQGLDVTSPWYAKEDMTMTGYLDGQVVFTQTVHATPDAISHFTGAYTVDDIKIAMTIVDSSTGERQGGGGFIAFDNMAHDAFLPL